MRRREVLTLLTGAAALRPSTARLQPTRKLPRVGFLGALSPSLYAGQVAALLSGLRELGYIECRDAVIHEHCRRIDRDKRIEPRQLESR